MKGRKGMAACAAAVLVLGLGLWAACAGCNHVEKPYERLTIGSHQITVEVVATNAERARGLMYRRTLEPDHGMLFVYPDERVMRFWMRNTQVPLDIAYIGMDGVIQEVRYMKPFDEVSVVSKQPARYALEMNFGWFDAHKLGAGDAVTMPDSVRAVVGEK